MEDLKDAFSTFDIELNPDDLRADNHGSIGVMGRLGMRVEKNLCYHPTWLMVCVLENIQ